MINASWYKPSSSALLGKGKASFHGFPHTILGPRAKEMAHVSSTCWLLIWKITSLVGDVVWWLRAWTLQWKFWAQISISHFIALNVATLLVALPSSDNGSSDTSLTESRWSYVRHLAHTRGLWYDAAVGGQMTMFLPTNLALYCR
jgi:hypothetical protein